MSDFTKLVKTVHELRVKCPWDRKQTWSSLRPLTIEETYELSEALDHEDPEEIKKELGDLLLHVIFYSRIGEEKGAFNLDDVCKSIREKLIHRHPHIYGDIKADTEEAVKSNWESLKKREKKGKSYLLDGVPKSLPPLVKADRIQDKAAATGFDWEKSEQVWEKVKEEIAELNEKLQSDAPVHEKESELGDVLFSLVNLARFEKLDAARSLEATNRKFMQRFRYMEDEAVKQNKSLSEMNIHELENLWQNAKKK